jgi:hypothetical protein
MTTQIVFKTDSSFKAQAMKKAKADGVTLKAVLYHALKLYVEDKLKFSLQPEEPEEPEIEIIEVPLAIQRKMNRVGSLLEKI